MIIVISYYLITTLVALANLIILLSSSEGKKTSYFYIILALLITIDNCGYLSVALSKSVGEAILATKLCYIGGCFIPVVVFIITCSICNFKLPNWLRNGMYAYSFIVYAMVCSIGFSDFYYSSVYAYMYKDAFVLGHEYGIGHIFFYVILLGYTAIELVLLLYSLNKKYAVSRKNLWALIALEITNIAAFIVGKMVHASVEVMPFMYMVGGWILIYLHHRGIIYNVEDNVVGSLINQEYYGYIMFDNNMRYLGCNNAAVAIFPEIVECKVDLHVRNKPKIEMVINWINQYCMEISEKFSYESGGKHYECRIERIWHKQKACGFIVEMREDTDRYNYMRLISNYNAELETKVEEKTQHIKSIQSKVLFGMANMVENRDDNTGGHIKRTSDVIKILLDAIRENQLVSLDDELYDDIIRAAPMHDLGKIGIDDVILKKPARLTDEEMAIMQTHAEKSAVMVERILNGVEEEHFVKVATNIAKYHHEKWNGKGYPEHLKGEEIPLEARIMAVADVYDALVSKRCYKEPMSFEEAFEVMESSMGSHFDPQLKKAFILSRKKLEKYYAKDRDCVYIS